MGQGLSSRTTTLGGLYRPRTELTKQADYRRLSQVGYRYTQCIGAHCVYKWEQ